MSTASQSRLARQKPNVTLRSGKKSMAVGAHKSQRSYAMAAEDTSKGVVSR